MKKSIILIFILCSITAFSQNNKSFQIGLGSSFLGSGDILAGVLETELNYKLNRYFSSSLGFNVAYGSETFLENITDKTSYQQLNTNIYLSPFRNNRVVDFKFGSGFSFNYVWEERMINSDISSPIMGESIRYAVGFNMIIETTFNLKNDFLFGIKAFTQPYMNSDINSGIMLKVGKSF